MAERYAPVPYSSSPTASPDTITRPEPRLSVQATPNDFGAQVGQAVEKLGQTGEELGNKAIDLAQYQTGIANETAATAAEVQFSQKVGSAYGQFATLTGSQAVAAVPQVKAAIAQAQQEALAGLPGGAARSASMMTARIAAQRIIDVDTYGAQQQKQALRDQGLNLVNASMNLDVPTATNPVAWNDRVAAVKDGVGKQMNDDLMPHLQVDPTTGATSINDSTPEGANAKTAYQKNIGDAMGQLWANRISTIANSPQHGPIAAQQMFDDNKDQISPAAAAHISATLAPQVYQTHVTQAYSNGLNEVKTDYFNHLTNPPPSTKATTDIADAIHNFGEGGKLVSPTSVDGAVGGWQITPGTFAQYAKPGETIDNPKDNETVGRRIIDDYKQRFNNDPQRIAVAYFSGPDNVAPTGSPTPWIQDRKDGNGTSTSQYVQKVVSGMGNPQATSQTQGQQPPSKPYATNDDGSLMSQSDYMQLNKSAILSKWATWADRQMPGDLQFRNAVVERARQQIADAKEGQDARYRQDNSFVIKAINGDMTNGKPPASYMELAAIPNVKAVLNRVEAQDPKFAQGIDTMISRVNKGDNKDVITYGQGFKQTQQDIWDGKITDERTLQHGVSSGDLTQAGYDRATKLLESKGTPEGNSEAEMQQAAFRTVQGVITHGNPTSPQAQAVWSNALPSLYKAIDERKSRKVPVPAGQYYDSKNKEFIGNDVQAFTMEKATALRAQIDANKASGKIRSLANIIDDALANRNNPVKQSQLRQEAIDAGYYDPKAPPVPQAGQ